jgi:hypothetical protein
MNGLADIIPLDSRRIRAKRAQHPAQHGQPRTPASGRRKRIAAFCVGLVALTGILVVVDRAVVSSNSVPVTPAATLSPELRRALHDRTLADVAASCTLPEARAAGLLREHCLEQARFLEKLSQCTGDCARLTGDILGVP